MTSCPVCALPLDDPIRETNGESYVVSCPNCGKYEATGSTLAMLPAWREKHPKSVPVLSHALWRMHASTDFPHLHEQLLRDNEPREALPSIGEQADNFILELAAATGSPGHDIPLRTSHWVARIGAADRAAVRLVIDALQQKKFLIEKQAEVGLRYQITFAGWQYVEELRRGQHESRKAFFASKWGDPQLDRMLIDVLIPAVAQTGFRLFRLDHDPRAGLIDDRMRVEIRTSKFVIADLTHDNSGAYWEAGYAEGLGKPVIFVCEKSVFAESETHFDTNHHLTVVWDEDDLVGTANRLKATIRATLPGDAVLEDESSS